MILIEELLIPAHDSCWVFEPYQGLRVRVNALGAIDALGVSGAGLPVVHQVVRRVDGSTHWGSNRLGQFWST